MTSYTVMIHKQDPETAVFIPHKFSWIAFACPVIWGIAKGLLLWTVLVLVIWSIAFFLLPVIVLGIFLSLINMWFALEAPFFMEKAYSRLGYDVQGVVCADNAEEAEEIFFRRNLNRPWG